MSRASVASDGSQANGSSSDPDISEDGRFVVFSSSASNLVPNDTNSTTDVFVRDNVDQTTERVSVSSTGTQGNALSWQPTISRDGRYVAFSSLATNLVGNDLNPSADIYRHDRQTGLTELVSRDESGNQLTGGAGVEPDLDIGDHVAFTFAAGGVPNQVWVFSVGDGVGQMASRQKVSNGSSTTWNPGDGDSGNPTLWSRSVMFESNASNLSPVTDGSNGFADENGVSDVFSYRYESFDPAGVRLISHATGGIPRSANGASRNLAYRDVVVSGTWVFETRATDIAGGNPEPKIVFTWLDGPPGLIAVGDSPSVSGRYVSFVTDQPLVPSDTDDQRDTYAVEPVSNAQPFILSTGAIVANDATTAATGRLSLDGRYVVFSTTAANIVQGDTNGATDVFVRATRVPAISSIFPTQFARGTTTTTTVTGEYFSNVWGLVAWSSGTGVSMQVDSIRSQGTQADLTVTVDPNAATGDRDLTVAIPGTGPGLDAGSADVCFDCITVA